MPPKRNNGTLSRSEEIVLLAVLRVKEDAYGISIRDWILETTGREWSLASIYEPLSKLVRKGLLEKRRGEPTMERGGRHKVLYGLTPLGKQELAGMFHAHRRMWAGVEQQHLGLGGEQ